MLKNSKVLLFYAKNSYKIVMNRFIVVNNLVTFKFLFQFFYNLLR